MFEYTEYSKKKIPILNFFCTRKTLYIYVKHFKKKNSNSMYIFACASKKWQNNQRIDGGRILVEDTNYISLHILYR